MAEFRMPSLGADMDEGTLLEWLVHPGDEVHKGDVVAVVDTAKAAVEVECFVSGVVDRLLVEPGQTVAVGTPLATLGDATSTEPSVPTPRVRTPQVRSPLVRHRAESVGIDLTTVAGSGPGGAIRREDVEHAAVTRPRITPYARRLAREQGIDLTQVTGSGDAGAIRAGDLSSKVVAVPAPPRAVAAPREAPRRKGSDDHRMREAIARLMTRSNAEIPHYYLRTTIDLQAATSWLHEHNRSVPVADRVVPAALLLAATARAAVEVPAVNGFWIDDQLQQAAGVHLGVAVSLRSGGMVTPAIHDAQTLTVTEIMSRLRDLVVRARGGRLRASELTDATLTVTNLGDQGVEEVFGVIYPPQVALVGFGKVVERPWAVDGLLGVRPLVTATLAADHRATDGYVGARYLARIDRILQRPEEL